MFSKERLKVGADKLGTRVCRSCAKVRASRSFVALRPAMEGVCAGTGSQFWLLGYRTPQPSEGVSACRPGSRFCILAWVIVGSVELRSGFLGAHDYKNSPHLLARRKKTAKGFLTAEK
jgi:hypothetical protein